MLNFLRASGPLLKLGVILALAASSEAFAEVKYKKNTTVDFEGATIEGKSRKPYSAYVSQKAQKGAADLAEWNPDFSQRLKLSRRKWEHSK